MLIHSGHMNFTQMEETLEHGRLLQLLSDMPYSWNYMIISVIVLQGIDYTVDR